LSGMFSLNNIELPNFLSLKLAFLTNYGVKFGGFTNDIQGNYFTPIWLIGGFILILVFKNSIEKLNLFKPNFTQAIILGLLLFGTILQIGAESEFLYFNF